MVLSSCLYPSPSVRKSTMSACKPPHRLASPSEPAVPSLIVSPARKLPDVTLLRLEGTERKALVPTPKCYDEAVSQARDTFLPRTPLEDVRLLVSMPQIDSRFPSETVEITPLSWSLVAASKKGATLNLGVRALPFARPADRASRHFGIFVNVTQTGSRIPLCVNSSDTVLSVKERLQDKEGVPANDQRLIFAGKQLTDEWTLEQYGVTENSVIHVVFALRGGKPVIYLFSPDDLRASIRLTLTPQWSFSCVYPPARIVCIAGEQEVRWNVDVRKHCLVDLATGNDEAYLFWEALSNPPGQLPDSPPASRPGSPEQSLRLAFDPSKPIIEPTNSVVLSVEQVPAYLQKALAALYLHVEARTSFITYWLPAIQKHKHVALRFLPQEEYEQAARLDISPAPAVVTRVFMLFRGLSDEDACTWRAASMSAESPACWKRVVGVKECAADETLYRALEWGGMEVHG